MERNGAIDIDERSVGWSDADATPVTASTETLTTGYPDAASISVDQRELDGSAARPRPGFWLDPGPRRTKSRAA